MCLHVYICIKGNVYSFSKFSPFLFIFCFVFFVPFLQADIGLALLAGHANANTTEDIVNSDTAAGAKGQKVGLIGDAGELLALIVFCCLNGFLFLHFAFCILHSPCVYLRCVIVLDVGDANVKHNIT